MAKRVILTFTDNPIIGVGFNIGITVNSLNVVYGLGQTYMSLEYDVADTIPTKIQVQATLSQTIDKTLSFLTAYWVADFVSYKRVNDTVEILVNADDVGIGIGGSNANITVLVQDVLESENLNLRYFFQYTNTVGDSFLCQIYKKQYVGEQIEISGTATLEKGSVKDHLDSIRGTGLSLQLEATESLTLDDLYTDNEQEFTVKFYKNNVILFRGFLKPDGVFQSFVRDTWMLSLDCVDGLGALSNLSFVKDNGLRFVGKMKASDIVYYCLKRTGILLPINTSINTLYDGLIPSDNLDILTKINMNADRFFKSDSQGTGDGTLMSCEEVLKSVLDVFCACITQENGEWYIYKPNEFYVNHYVLFRRYDINNVYIGNVTVNMNKSIGSQIDNYYPHHCSGNQKIEIKGGVSAFRLGYKYGFVEGLLLNSSFKRESTDFLNWTENSLVGWINNPSTTNGFLHNPLSRISTSRTLMLTSELSEISETDLVNIKISYNAQTGGFNPAYLVFRVRIGTYYLKKDGSWTTSPTFIIIKVEQTGSRANFDYTISAQETPISGDIYAEIYRSEVESYFYAYYPIEITDFNIIPNLAGLGGVVGEFHTVSRIEKVSSIVKENKTVYNGDNAGVIYLGAIFKDDETTPTSTWSRRGSFESYAILRIAAEEELRINQKPLKLFSGSTFGYVPYLSIISINNISGKFMAIDYSYDTAKNITTFKLLELYSEEIQDILYKFALDYGNSVKPTITS